MTDKTNAEVLRGAADYIEEHGLARFRRLTDDGRACIVGAVEIARHGAVEIEREDNPYDDPALRFVEQIVGTDPSHWSDKEDRSAHEVVTVLRTAADSAEAQA